MSWASRRRAFIVGGILALAIGVIAVVLVATLYDTPSCTDGKQNQNEDGVDCGGPCAYLCSAQVAAPSVRFVRQLASPSGRTDVIAYLDNPNPTAAVRGARFTIELYGVDNVVVGTKEATADLPPSSTVPVFVPNFFSGYQKVARAFLTFHADSLQWFTYTDARTIPRVIGTDIESGDTPRITASIANDDARALYDVLLVATVFDEKGNVIAASQTVVPMMSPGSVEVAIFTWLVPFTAPPARVDVFPIIPLPAS